jgi:hypothetical protein
MSTVIVFWENIPDDSKVLLLIVTENDKNKLISWNEHYINAKESSKIEEEMTKYFYDEEGNWLHKLNEMQLPFNLEKVKDAIIVKMGFLQ